MDEIMENQATEQNEVFGDGGQNGVVDVQENPVDDGQGAVVDTQEAEEEEQRQERAGAETERRRAPQSHQDNAAARAARMRAEAETERRVRRQYEETLAEVGVVNPYTGKPIQTFEELKSYGERFKEDNLKKRAQAEGRSVDELREEEENRTFVTRKRREEQERKQLEARMSQQHDFMVGDLQRFQEEFPDVDVTKLEGNARFRKFAGKRLYQEPLAELYRDFTEVVSETERTAVAKADSRRARGTGGGQGGSGAALTAEQAAELEEWNRNNPEMRMTAKEYLAR